MGQKVSLQDLISVIVPVYNKERAFDKCVHSILAQTYSNWELLLIDDGSTDSSGAICDRYAEQDPRIRVFHKANGGVSSARNLGLDNAQGEWITYIDADDYFEPSALEILLSTALKYNTDIATANFQIECQNKKTPVCNSWKTQRIRNNFRAWYFTSAIPGPGAALFKKNVFQAIRFNESICRYEDAQLLFDVLRKHTMAYSPQFVMTYAQDYSSLSRQLSHPEKDFIFHMDFADKSLWEKLVLGSLLNEGLAHYTQYTEIIRNQYKDSLIYAYIDCKIRRFKKWKTAYYRFITGTKA